MSTAYVLKYHSALPCMPLDVFWNLNTYIWNISSIFWISRHPSIIKYLLTVICIFNKIKCSWRSNLSVLTSRSFRFKIDHIIYILLHLWLFSILFLQNRNNSHTLPHCPFCSPMLTILVIFLCLFNQKDTHTAYTFVSLFYKLGPCHVHVFWSFFLTELYLVKNFQIKWHICNSFILMAAFYSIVWVLWIFPKSFYFCF